MVSSRRLLLRNSRGIREFSGPSSLFNFHATELKKQRYTRFGGNFRRTAETGKSHDIDPPERIGCRCSRIPVEPGCLCSADSLTVGSARFARRTGRNPVACGCMCGLHSGDSGSNSRGSGRCSRLCSSINCRASPSRSRASSAAAAARRRGRCTEIDRSLADPARPCRTRRNRGSHHFPQRQRQRQRRSGQPRLIPSEELKKGGFRAALFHASIRRSNECEAGNLDVEK